MATIQKSLFIYDKALQVENNLSILVPYLVRQVKELWCLATDAINVKGNVVQNSSNNGWNVNYNGNTNNNNKTNAYFVLPVLDN